MEMKSLIFMLTTFSTSSPYKTTPRPLKWVGVKLPKSELLASKKRPRKRKRKHRKNRKRKRKKNRSKKRKNRKKNGRRGRTRRRNNKSQQPKKRKLGVISFESPFQKFHYVLR